MANQAYVTDIKGNRSELHIILHPAAMLDVSRSPDLVKKYQRNLKLVKGPNPKFLYTLPKTVKTADDILEEIKNLITDLKELVIEEQRKEQKI